MARGVAPLATGAVAADVACPSAWPEREAVTVTVSRLPAWAAVTTCDAPVAPLIATPSAAHR